MTKQELSFSTPTQAPLQDAPHLPKATLQSHLCVPAAGAAAETQSQLSTAPESWRTTGNSPAPPTLAHFLFPSN